MLVNLSGDEEVLKLLAEDDKFVETLLVKLTVSTSLIFLLMKLTKWLQY
jgi:hypothetical protein